MMNPSATARSGGGAPTSGRGSAAARRILVVDDDRKTVASVRLYLEHGGFRVDEAFDGPSALRIARDRRPDLAVVDVMLPGASGIQVCRTLRAEGEVPVILLTARTTEDDKVAGLGSGADDYVTKPFSPRELVARIHAVLRRAAPEGSGWLRATELRGLAVDPARHEVRRHGERIELTPSEFRILELLARHPGRVFSRGELVERVFGADHEGLERTIDAHVKNLRKKIEPDRARPTLLVTVFGVGYKLALDEDPMAADAG
jgi:DNA-binding response OmpR family regulator